MSQEYYDYLKNHPEEVSLYRIGRRFEYATMKKLRKHGFYCIRKFGSKGFEDIVAFKSGLLLFVQCKYSRYKDTTPKGNLTEENEKGLIALANRYNGAAVFAGVLKHRMYFMIFNGRKWVHWSPN